MAPLSADLPFLGELFLCSTARAYLENMRPSRARGGLVARTLGRVEIEERLDNLIRRSGEDAVNRLRDEIRVLGPTLDLDEEAAALDALIGALLGTREAELSAPSAVARRQGRPCDPDRLALFQMFLIAEVHPFADGNGRIARIMMNAELAAAGEERIVVPTVYRANYLSALKALSQTGRPEPLIRMLDYAQRWTSAVDWRSLDEARRELVNCNAFLDPNVAEVEGRRLQMPS